MKMWGIVAVGVVREGVPKNFIAPMYRAHCALIFAIAQLSCYHRAFCAAENQIRRTYVIPNYVILSYKNSGMRDSVHSSWMTSRPLGARNSIRSYDRRLSTNVRKHVRELITSCDQITS